MVSMIEAVSPIFEPIFGENHFFGWPPQRPRNGAAPFGRKTFDRQTFGRQTTGLQSNVFKSIVLQKSN